MPATCASKRHVPAVLVGVHPAVLGHHPAHVAGLVGAQRGTARPPVGAAEHLLDRLHRGEQTVLRGRRQRRQQRRHLGPRPLLQIVERAPALGGERDQALAAVAARGGPAHQAAALEALQHAAQVGGVEVEVAAEVGGRRRRIAVRLVEHPHLRQRQRAVQVVLVQHADAPGVEPVEAADGLDAIVERRGRRHGSLRVVPMVQQLVDRCQLSAAWPVWRRRSCRAFA